MNINPYLGSFQLSGIASGIDTQAMVEKLLEIEQQPLNRAQEKFDTLKYQQKLWMEIDNKLEDFYDYLISFKLKSNLIPKKAESSDEQVLTANAPADAENSTFYLKVVSLASPTILAGEGIDPSIKKSSTISSIVGDTEEASVSITKGTQSVNLSVSGEETIEDFINKINNSGLNVEARFDEYNGKFFILNKENGDIDISVTAESDSNGQTLIEALKIDDSSVSKTVGQYGQVELSFDGVNKSATYDDLQDNTLNIFGVNIDLKSTSNAYVKVSVEQNIDKSVETIKEFVDKYNEIITYVYDLLHEEKVTNKSEEDMTEEDYMKGALKGNRNLENIFYNLRNILYSSVNLDNAGSQYKDLFSIGISSGDAGANYQNTMKGLLTLDEEKLRKTLEENPEDVWKLFATNDKVNNEYGVSQRVQNYLYEVTKFNGYIDRIAGTNGTIGNQMRLLAKDMTNLLDRLQRKEARYYAQFTAMEQAIQQMSVQGMYIQNAFSNNK